jgi:UDP-glucose 4-epimerase
VTAGHDVAVVDDLSTGTRRQVHSKARFYQLDIRKPELEKVFEKEKPEVVSHQAARANVRESMELPLLYADVNVLGSLNLLECGRRHGLKKVIYASTGGAVYGEPRMLPVPEEHPVNPLDPYGASKHHVEHYLFLYQANFGIKHTVLRYPNVYGPRQDPRGEAGVVAIFTGQMLSGKTPVIHGSGDQERDFVYVSDVVRAHLAGLDSEVTGHFNVGTGRQVDVNTVFEMIAERIGTSLGKRHGPPRPGDQRTSALDWTLIREKLGWQPQVSLEEGLSATVDWFRRNQEQA